MWFTTASLTPAILLGLGSLFGGQWPLVAVISITVFAAVMDQLPAPPQGVPRVAARLNILLGLVHLALVPLAIYGVSYSPVILNKVLLITGYGLFFGQISNANAHELIHSPRRALRRLGMIVYSTLLHGHHVSAHLRVHHVYAASAKDPSTARRGEGFYRFVIRAMPGEFIAGFHAEPRRPHPYITYGVIGVLPLGLGIVIAGLPGALIWITIAIYAQIQLFLSDYVQHYGLTRPRTDAGQLVPIAPHHSWNAPQWYSSAMMLNAPRHSDHHLHPMRAYPDLRLTPDMPMLPYALPVMAVIALVPPLWRRVMHRQLDRLGIKAPI